MRFKCIEHGEIDQVQVDGYTIGHMTKHVNELDLEGIQFTVENPQGDELEPEHVKHDAGKYLQKFKSVEQQIVDAFDGADGIDLGLECPDCGFPETVRIERA